MRLRITRKSELAARALRELARTGGVQKGDALAGAVGTSAAFLAQAVTPLVRAGWLGSDPGPTGGYRLEPAASRRSILELIETIEGPTADGRCVLSPGSCAEVTRVGPCALHDAWTKARRSLLAELAGMPALGVRGGGPRARRAARRRAGTRSTGARSGGR